MMVGHDELNAKQRKISEPIVTDPIVPQTQPQIVNVTNVATVTTANPGTNGNIPDLTTMSDNDLIRYINPSCFDQGTFCDN